VKTPQTARSQCSSEIDHAANPVSFKSVLGSESYGQAPSKAAKELVSHRSGGAPCSPSSPNSIQYFHDAMSIERLREQDYSPLLKYTGADSRLKRSSSLTGSVSAR
jgi:hypothetical protein